MLLEGYLNGEERAHARSLHRLHDRRRFTAARGGTRLLLGKLLDEDPAGLVFVYGTKGKPYLKGASRDWIFFNLSHSADVAVLGVCNGVSIGIDIEARRSAIDLDDLAASVLSSRERKLLATTPPNERQAVLLRIWTAKESVLKATGEGLSRPPQEVEVDIADEEAPHLVRIGNLETSGWTLFSRHLHCPWRRETAVVTVAVPRSDAICRFIETDWELPWP